VLGWPCRWLIMRSKNSVWAAPREDIDRIVSGRSSLTQHSSHAVDLAEVLELKRFGVLSKTAWCSEKKHTTNDVYHTTYRGLHRIGGVSYPSLRYLWQQTPNAILRVLPFLQPRTSYLRAD